MFLNQTLLWYLPKSNFLFCLSRNLRWSKSRTLVKADPGPLPAAMMELFVTLVYLSKPYIKVLSQGLPSEMLVGALDLFLITMVFRKILG